MNNNTLLPDCQLFIKNNLRTDISSLLLKKQLFDGISQKELVEQIESKNKCQKKLPTWFNTENIYYPNKLNIEQTSSVSQGRWKKGVSTGERRDRDQDRTRKIVFAMLNSQTANSIPRPYCDLVIELFEKVQSDDISGNQI